MQTHTQRKEAFMSKAIKEHEATLNAYDKQKNKFGEEIQKTLELDKSKEGMRRYLR